MKIHNPKFYTFEYDIAPQVVLLDKEVEYTLKGLGIETALAPNKEYMIRILPQEEIATRKTLVIGDENCYEEVLATTDENGVLKFKYTLNKEQIYAFRLLNFENGEWKKLKDLRVFGAQKDLWERVPMRGNTHCHACHSVDGHEDPAVAAAWYRKAGYDYVAITDHHKIDGSKYAIEKLADMPHEMSLYYGEEVHVPNAYIHAVNVGAVLEGGIGLDKYYHEHEAEVNKEVDEIATQYAETLPSGVEPYDWAWRKWIADTIHKNGGIAIIAHPFWNYDAHNTSNAMLEYLVKTGLYDAVEVIMGQEPDSFESNMQIAYWNDLRANGLQIPVVGVDDAHRRPHSWDYECAYNVSYTVIFSKSPDFNGFSDAIKNGYSTAVESYGDAPEHVTGTYRLTKFTIFLLEQYFPKHDELCFEEGCRMIGAYHGDEESLEILKMLNGRVKRFTDRFFGRD